MLSTLNNDIKKAELLTNLYANFSNQTDKFNQLVDLNTDEKLQQYCILEDNISQLKKKFNELEKSEDETNKSLVQNEYKPIVLKEKLNNLERNVETAKIQTKHQQQILSLTPEIELVKIALQSKLNNIDDLFSTPLEHQENILKTLEMDKQKISSLLESIPDIEEASPLKESGNFELSKLSDLIKRLGTAVGEKMAALTAFLATKSEIESQLEDIGKEIAKHETNIEPSNEKLTILKKQNKKLSKLKEKIANEVAEGNLDYEKKEELYQLKKSLDLMNEKVSKTGKNIEKLIAQKITEDERNEEIANKNKELVSLINETNIVLNNITALPKNYEQLALRIDQAISEAQEFFLNNENLLSTISTATTLADNLKNRFNNWLIFVEQKNIANQQLDLARKPMQKLENKPIRSLQEAKRDLDDLNVRILIISILIKINNFFILRYINS